MLNLPKLVNDTVKDTLQTQHRPNDAASLSPMALVGGEEVKNPATRQPDAAAAQNELQK